MTVFAWILLCVAILRYFAIGWMQRALSLFDLAVAIFLLIYLKIIG
jgi:hypothetical protein